jgi:hypothetical protein
MPNAILTGEIYFTCSPIFYDEIHSPPHDDVERLIDLSYFITQTAINHRIGINLYCNLTENGLRRYPLKNHAKEGYLPYEILDNPLTNECFDLFRNIAYSEKGFTVANIANTGLLRVQHFFEDIFQDERIAYATLHMEDVHGIAKKTYEYTIEAGMLCDAIERVPNDNNRLDIPAVRFVMARGAQHI